MDKDLALLHEKIDYLTEQFEAQQRQREAWDELKQDLIPITNHMIKLSINELEEIGTDFELEDLLFLLKRFLRNTHLWMHLLDRLEAIMDLADEASVLGKQAFANTIETLHQLERVGYFAFARGGYYVLQRIVTEFSEEDVRALGDNIVNILTTVQKMTQPEMLTLANSAIDSMRDQTIENVKPPSTLSLLRQLSDPKVRIGLSKMLSIVSSLADENAGEIKN
ncbi:MAG TPA: DUF1641 domain-containing protein [Anaerolineae bacterium]|nr:DUF1641 domain-containing protein [Anaerolineae bacterium]